MTFRARPLQLRRTATAREDWSMRLASIRARVVRLLRGIERHFLRHRPSAYALSVVVTLATVLCRHSLDAAWGTTKPFMLFFPALMVVGRLGGFGPGVLSTLLSSLAIDYFWTEPYLELHVPESKNMASFAIFIASGLLVSALNGSLLASMRRAGRLHDARETLLAIVAHDLRNPLGAIAMNAELLARPGRTPEATQHALATIERSVLRMDRLISDVLDANKLETGRVDVVLREEPISPLALEALETFLPSAKAHEIELTSAVPTDLPSVRCDRERVLQILGNILGNALKFTPAGGKVALSATRKERFVSLLVRDSGPGIAPRDLPHVFDRYWKKGGAGTGLGLYIVHGLVAAQGGEAWVESEPGRGTSVFVTLPIAD
jgi:signal transduction histidine kinase